MFCNIFTIAADAMASGAPKDAAVAMTAPVLSTLPPNHAPASASRSPSATARLGSATMHGMVSSEDTATAKLAPSFTRSALASATPADEPQISVTPEVMMAVSWSMYQPPMTDAATNSVGVSIQDTSTALPTSGTSCATSTNNSVKDVLMNSSIVMTSFSHARPDVGTFTSSMPIAIANTESPMWTARSAVCDARILHTAVTTNTTVHATANCRAVSFGFEGCVAAAPSSGSLQW